MPIFVHLAISTRDIDQNIVLLVFLVRKLGCVVGQEYAQTGKQSLLTLFISTSTQYRRKMRVSMKFPLF